MTDCKARQRQEGIAGQGRTLQGAGHGRAWHDRAGQGMAQLGRAGQGIAGHVICPCMAGQRNQSRAGQGIARHSRA